MNLSSIVVRVARRVSDLGSMPLRLVRTVAHQALDALDERRARIDRDASLISTLDQSGTNFP